MLKTGQKKKLQTKNGTNWVVVHACNWRKASQFNLTFLEKLKKEQKHIRDYTHPEYYFACGFEQKKHL